MALGFRNGRELVQQRRSIAARQRVHRVTLRNALTARGWLTHVHGNEPSTHTATAGALTPVPLGTPLPNDVTRRCCRFYGVSGAGHGSLPHIRHIIGTKGTSPQLSRSLLLAMLAFIFSRVRTVGLKAVHRPCMPAHLVCVSSAVFYYYYDGRAPF